ncbi:MAG: hypothetical protein HRT66_05940 [Flavobacteriaceae bacterium]|nr:hypothetical protein [Flavobacteriaceae bacterium]
MSRFVFVILVSLILSCSSDSNDSDVYLIKSVTHVDFKFSYLDEFYFYDGDYITDIYYGDGSHEEYKYDEKGNLTNTGAGWINYLYDNENRLIEVKNYKEETTYTVTYEGLKTTVNSYRSGEIHETYEHTLNDKGQIIEIKDLTQKEASNYATLREYYYDSRGNITHVIYYDSKGVQKDILRYKYDNNPNPLYYAYKHIYKSIYTIKCFKNIPNYVTWGITPNNMISIGEEGDTVYQYKYNEYGYPILIGHIYDYNKENYKSIDTELIYY